MNVKGNHNGHEYKSLSKSMTTSAVVGAVVVVVFLAMDLEDVS